MDRSLQRKMKKGCRYREGGHRPFPPNPQNSKNAFKRKKDREKERIRGEGMLITKGWKERDGQMKRLSKKN